MNINFLARVTGTLRGRLALWFLTSIGLIFCLLALAIGSVFWLTLQNQIDHHIHITVNEAHQIVEDYRGIERESLLKNIISAQGMTVVVLSPDGAPIIETNSSDVAISTEHQLQKILTVTQLNQRTPIHFTESGIRFAAMPVQVSAGKGIVAVGYSTKVLYATFYTMLLVSTGIVILLILPTTYFGYVFLKRQLRPLEMIADQAKSVSDLSSLSKRIHISSPTKELETIQTALNLMLSQLEKMFKSEREFFSDAAHTLKTPLAVLRSQLENSSLSKKDKQGLLSTIDSTSETIQDLLLLSKVGRRPEQITKFSLSNIMTDLAELATSLGEEQNLQVTADIEPRVMFKADRILVQRALSNIVYNAVMYNRSSGNISLSLKKQSKNIIIKVQDTGKGIRKQDFDQLFVRFVRGNNADSSGSGLGLAIAKAVIEYFGGTINIKSILDQGTEVTVRL